LAKYLDLTVNQMRRLKTHGEKRVQAILEVFHGVHEMLGHSRQLSHLHAELRPKFAVAILSKCGSTPASKCSGLRRKDWVSSRHTIRSNSKPGVCV
jgi:hypothetical protein